MKTYNVLAICDPFHSKKHYRGEEVVRYTGTTPTKWIMERALTLDEAFAVLDRYTFDLGDGYGWEDDQSIASLREDLLSEADGEDEASIDEALSWYEGEGVYAYGEPNVRVYKHGDMSLDDDVVTYMIEEA